MRKGHNFLKVLFSVTLVLMLALAGCSDKSSTDGSSGKDVKLRVLIWGNGPSEIAGEEEIYKEFEKEHENIKVDLIYVPWDDQSDKFVTMSAGGDQPDLVWIKSGVSEFATKGLLKPLDEYIDADGIDKADWLPGGLDLTSWDGEIFGLPRDIITFHIAYNKDMFDKAGVDYPQEGWTWADFLETAKKLTVEENGRIEQYGIATYSWEEAVIENGGRLFNDEGTEVLFDKPEVIEAVQWVSDLSNVEHAAPTPTEAQGLGDLFLAEKAAMAFAGPWNWRAYTDEGEFNWDIAEVPGGKAGSKSRLLGLPISIGAKSKHPEEAWTLLKWITHGGGQDIQSDRVGAYPSVKRSVDKFSEGEFAPDSVDVVHEAMANNTVAEVKFPKYNEAYAMLTPVIEQIMTGDVKASDALPKIADEIRQKFDMK